MEVYPTFWERLPKHKCREILTLQRQEYGGDRFWSDMALQIESAALGDNVELFSLFHKAIIIRRTISEMIRYNNNVPVNANMD